MEAFTYTQIRNNFSETMNKVCENHAPVIITRQNKPPVVMLSLEDYSAIEETMYLMGNPKNAKKLIESLEQYKNSNISEHGLIEE